MINENVKLNGAKMTLDEFVYKYVNQVLNIKLWGTQTKLSFKSQQTPTIEQDIDDTSETEDADVDQVEDEIEKSPEFDAATFINDQLGEDVLP